LDKKRGIIHRKWVERFLRVWFNPARRVSPVSFEAPSCAMIAPLLRALVLVSVAILVSEGYVVIEATRAPEGYENEWGFFFGVELGAPA
jgi:hypothetical protein